MYTVKEVRKYLDSAIPATTARGGNNEQNFSDAYVRVLRLVWRLHLLRNLVYDADATGRTDESLRCDYHRVADWTVLRWSQHRLGTSRHQLSLPVTTTGSVVET